MAGEIYAASTTDTEQQVEAALAQDEAVHHGETPPRSGSTTDSRFDVAKAAMLYTDDAKVYTSGAEFPGSAVGIAVGNPIVQIPPPTDGVHIRSTTDDAEQVEAQRKEAVEEKEANRVDYLTRTPKVEKNKPSRNIRITCSRSSD